MSRIIELSWEVLSRSKLGRAAHLAVRDARAAEISSMAAGLAYTSVLSIVPLLAVLYAVFARLGGLKYAYGKVQPLLIKTLSEGAGDSARRTLEHFLANAHTKGLGWVGFAGLLVTAIMAYTEIAKAFHKIWDMKKVAPFISRVTKVLTLVIVSPALLALSLSLTTVLATHAVKVPWLSRGLAQIVAFFVSYLLFLMLYALIPATRLPSRLLLRGTILPAALWEITKAAFAVYTTRVVKYASIYGSLAAIPLFLLWIYLAWYIALFGAVWIRALQKDEARGFFSR